MTRRIRVPKARTGYPSKPKLSDTDMTNALRFGPRFEWLSPFAVLGEVRTSQPNRMPYGFVHAYFDAEGNLKTDVKTFYSEEGARWAAAHLYRFHEDDRCRCIAVFYWTPKTVNYGPEADE